MKNIIAVLIVIAMIAAAIYVYPKNAVCVDCNKGKSCSTSYDCGEIGVCYCQYSYETEQDTGGGIPESGTCYFE